MILEYRTIMNLTVIYQEAMVIFFHPIVFINRVGKTAEMPPNVMQINLSVASCTGLY